MVLSCQRPKASSQELTGCAIVDSECWSEILLEEKLWHQVVVMVVDEAHCVYKRSKDFRPAYFMSFGH